MTRKRLIIAAVLLIAAVVVLNVLGYWNWTAFAAIATFLAVVVALLKEDITGLWRRPKLKATLRPEAPDCHKTEFVTRLPSDIRRKPCYYLRLWVKNHGKRRLRRQHPQWHV